jgi:hypothetical protein
MDVRAARPIFGWAHAFDAGVDLAVRMAVLY